MDNILTRGIALQYFDHPIVSIDDFKVVQKDAFKGFRNLCAVQMQGVVAIEQGAFSDCPLLEQVNLCEELQVIGENAFENSGIRYMLFSKGYRGLELNQLSSIPLNAYFSVKIRD